MNRLKTVSSIIFIIAVPILILTLGQNLIFRLPDASLYYFNDSQCLDQLYLSMSNSEMADTMTGLLNQLRPDPDTFNIFVDTGYDQLGLFSSRDSYNLLMMKKALDISSLLCLISFLLATAINIFLLRQDEKKLLRKCFAAGGLITVVLTILQMVALSAEGVRNQLLTIIGVRAFYEDSVLGTIMTGSFWNTMTFFLTAGSILILGVAAYIQYRLTRPPRIFY